MADDTPSRLAPRPEGGGPVTVGILYPEVWEPRPRAELDEDLDRLRALDPRIEVVDVRYSEPDELRVAKSSAEGDAAHLAPELTDEQRDAFARVEVVLTMDLPSDVAAVAPNLRMVQGLGAGVGQLVSVGLADGGIRLATAAGIGATSIAEFALGRLLAAWKRFDEIGEQQRERRWEPCYGKELAGTTVGVLGLGAIGAEIARRLDALGMEVLATRRSWEPGMTAPHVAELFGPDQLHEVLGRCEAVFAAVPETPDTVGTMDAAAFAAMPPGSFFCNVGRGSFVDEPALIDALERGHLGAAAIDVAAHEPLPADDPLWAAPNLAISPHSAASPDRYFANLHRLLRDNVVRYLAGEPLRNEVDLSRGY